MADLFVWHWTLSSVLRTGLMPAARSRGYTSTTPPETRCWTSRYIRSSLSIERWRPTQIWQTNQSILSPTGWSQVSVQLLHLYSHLTKSRGIHPNDVSLRSLKASACYEQTRQHLPSKTNIVHMLAWCSVRDERMVNSLCLLHREVQTVAFLGYWCVLTLLQIHNS